MATIYRSVKGRPIAKFIALMDEVQDELDNRTFEIAVRAEEALLQHRFEGHAAIEVDKGKVDRYVTLSDERGQKAAMSIEYGRSAYTVERTAPDGSKYEVEVGAMEGLFILHNAAHLQKKRTNKVKGLKL